MLKSKKLLSFFYSLLVFPPLLLAADEITITTYYPSPYGVYNQLQTSTLGVGDNDGDGGLDSGDVPNPTTNPGDVWIAGNLKISKTGNGIIFSDGTKQTTAAGDLYGGFHSSSQCTLLGGTVVIVGSNKICRFNSATCQGPFVQYSSYTTTVSNACDCGCGAYGRACTTGSHVWSNTDTIEGCQYCTDSQACSPRDIWCYATRTQIGCY